MNVYHCNKLNSFGSYSSLSWGWGLFFFSYKIIFIKILHCYLKVEIKDLNKKKNLKVRIYE